MTTALLASSRQMVPFVVYELRPAMASSILLYIINAIHIIFRHPSCSFHTRALVDFIAATI